MKIGIDSLNYQRIYQTVIKKGEISLDNHVLSLLGKQREKINQLIKKKEIIYGLNTGFGGLKNKNISPEDISELQTNLIVSHATGVGKPFPKKIVKTVMILIANYLSKGYSGVRPKVVETLAEMINKNVIPVVPEKGSVGSSGDLAPSSHLVLVLIGKGKAHFNGEIISGAKAMKKAKITPLVLKAKEGLALINNTATMTANSIFALSDANYLTDIADLGAALSIEALGASHKAFDERIHKIKPHKGQLLVAKRLRRLLAKSTMEDKTRIQDQYSIRCIPQVHGAIRDTIAYAEKVVNIEINSVTDNPLIFSLEKTVEVVSGGNFHGEAIALVMDALRIAVCELANIADRRICSLLDANHSFGLPPFLAKNAGLNSGLMVLQYTTASLVSENKILAHPACVDSIPTSANIEDFVSMGTIAARKTLEVLENVNYVLAIELIVACQAIDFRLNKGFKLAKETAKIYKQIRTIVPFFDRDQEYMSYVEQVVKMIENRDF